MTTTIQQAFDLPAPEDIRAMAFVIRLKDESGQTDASKKLVDEYVVTPAVKKELPVILQDMQETWERGDEYGRFIHGSFGSGKSHFMSLLGLLLEDDDYAWAKDAEVIRDNTDQRQWLDQAHLLVVRVHMLSVRGRDKGLDRIIYEAFTDALQRRDKEPFDFLHVDGVIEEARREAEQYGEAFFRNLEQAGIADRDYFETLPDAPEEDRELFARAYLEFKGRDPHGAGIDPDWGEGLQRLAEHAKSQGFGGVVLLVDEFLLWLAEKSGEEFAREINNLNVIVDHATGERSVPLYVFVARQRNLKDFFPDYTADDEIHEHLDHHSKRFEITKLQDVELRHIVKGRVLQPSQPEAVQQAVDELAETQRRVLPALLQEADVDYLKDVYPFHPALIEMLVDVTSLMQRERSALRLLYELLVIHYPDLPLGEFLPVGSAFDAIFPESGVEADRKADLLREIHRQYWQRLKLAMKQLFEEREEAGEPLSEARQRALDQLVKTVLLAEASPRLRQHEGLTIERLVQLNFADVEGETYRSRLRQAETDLGRLSQKVPDLQISGRGKTAVVRYLLGGVSLGEILRRARSKVDNYNQRSRVGFSAVRELFGLQDDRKFADGASKEGDFRLQWRGTRRTGRLVIRNVREMAYKDFESPRHGFAIIVDYPWDEPGHSVEEDRLHAERVAKAQGQQYTMCWLPRHLTPSELETATELAAVRFLLSDEGQEDLLVNLGQHDKDKVLDQARTRETNLRRQLEDTVRKAYNEGELFPLVRDVDTKIPFPDLADDLEHIAATLLDRQFPAHPHFKTRPTRKYLNLLLDWMVAASEADAPVGYDDDTERVLRQIGQPLELVDLGQVKAKLRLDSRYIKDVLRRVDSGSVPWDPIAEYLADEYGFQPDLIDLFLCFVASRGYRPLREGSGERVELKIGLKASLSVRLQRAKLVTPAQWSRLRELGPDLFPQVTRPSNHRSLQSQDRYANTLRKAAGERRQTLQGVHASLVRLEVDKEGRLEELQTAIKRLVPAVRETSDSFTVLTDLLDEWPDDASDPIRTVVRTVQVQSEALDALDRNARRHLQSGVDHPDLGEVVQSHLGDLDHLLGASQAERPLDREAIERWNKKAQDLVGKLLASKTKPIPPKPPEGTGGGPGGGVTPPPPEPPPGKTLLDGVQVRCDDPDEVGQLVGQLRRKLAELGPRSVKLDVVVREEGE